MWKKALLLSFALLLFCRPTVAQEYLFTPEMTQDTIQRQINSPTKYKKLTFAPGVYTKISSLTINPSLVSLVSAQGAKFLFPANQGEFTRYFNIIWVDNFESPSIIFNGGEFDMNENNQGRVSFNKEHQAAIFIDAASNGKINVVLNDISIRNSAGDGISIYRKSFVSIRGCQTNECFRGGLTVSGPGNEVIVDDLDARGNKFRSGIRLEPSGFNQRQVPAAYVLNKVRMNWFDFILGKGSSVILSDSIIEPINPLIATDGFQGYVYNEGGKVVIDNCLVYSNRQINFALTGNSRVSNCEFKLSKYEGDTFSIFVPITLRWYVRSAGEFNDNQKCVLDNCDFSIYNIDPVTTTCIGFRTFETHPYGGEKNFIVVKHNRFQQVAWTGVWKLEGKTAKTRLISMDNMLGDVLMENNK